MELYQRSQLVRGEGNEINGREMEMATTQKDWAMMTNNLEVWKENGKKIIQTRQLDQAFSLSYLLLWFFIHLEMVLSFVLGWYQCRCGFTQGHGHDSFLNWNSRFIPESKILVKSFLTLKKNTLITDIELVRFDTRKTMIQLDCVEMLHMRYQSYL